MSELTHFDAEGRAAMVDVSEKATTSRTAVARGRVTMAAETLALIQRGDRRLQLLQVLQGPAEQVSVLLQPLGHRRQVEVARVQLAAQLVPVQRTGNGSARHRTDCAALRRGR